MELSAEWRDVFKEINVTLHPHTMRKLDEAVGKTPDIRVVYRLIVENRSAFQRGVNEKEGYRLSTLVNLAKDQYAKWAAVIAEENTQRERYLEELMKRPKINYDSLPAMQDVADDHVDIVELLLHDESIWGVNEAVI